MTRKLCGRQNEWTEMGVSMNPQFCIEKLDKLNYTCYIEANKILYFNMLQKEKQVDVCNWESPRSI